MNLRRKILPDQPSSAVIVADGSRVREENLRRQAELTASMNELHWELAGSHDRTARADAAVATTSAELDQARRGLADARDAFSAALADVTFGSQALGATLGGAAGPSRLALADVPPDWLALYQAAAPVCSGLSWTVLAAIGSVESAHGRSDAPGVRDGANAAGAMGPMQFLAPSWAAYGADGDGDGVRDPYNPTDAVFGAANYLCAHGGGDPSQLAGAVWAYNHADWYVRQVLDLASAYGGSGLQAAPATAAALVADPNVRLSPEAKGDLLAGLVDRKVVDTLTAVAARHRIAVSVIETGHSMFVNGTDRVSNHYYGRAVDIYEVDGVPVSAANDAALELAVALLTANPSLRPDELGSPWPELAQFAGAFSDADHLDHLHLGWQTSSGSRP